MTGKKKFFKQAAVATATFLSILSAAAAANLNWKDVTSGLQEAKQSHKYVLADVYTDWCGWCKRLDKDTFTNSELTNFLSQKFVSVKANAEDGGAGQKLAGDYGVNGYPCALVFDPSGKMIGRVVGYKDAAGYQNALQNIMDHPSP
jgi:thioredoxin-related protein